MSMYMKHSGGNLLGWGAPPAVTPAMQVNVAQFTQMIQALSNAERQLKQAYRTLTEAASATGVLPAGVVNDYNALAQRVMVLNTQALDALQALPGIPAPSKPTWIPVIKMASTADPTTLVPVTDIQWLVAADYGLSGAKTKVVEEAADKVVEKVPWMDFLIKGTKVLAIAGAAAAGGAFALKMTNMIQAGSIASAKQAEVDASVQNQANKIFKDTQDACMAHGGDPTACTKNALAAYTTYIKNARQSGGGGSGIGFFGWLGIAAGIVATAVIVQRYRAGAFPFAPSSHGGGGYRHISARSTVPDVDDEG